ncbi:MAG: DUF4846 domain-containing protein [Hyphomicrobiaceae bacterium]
MQPTRHTDRHPILTLCVGTVLIAALSLAPAEANADTLAYPWPRASQNNDTLSERIPPPEGFVRRPVPAGSFADFLRSLPLAPRGSLVVHYDGTPRVAQSVHVAVVDIDIGDRDLQQCADFVMRLRAEWLWSQGAKDEIAFNYTGGGRVPYLRFARGERPSEDGRRWRRSGTPDDSYAGLRRYLTQVFAYAGTASLEKELDDVSASGTPQIGDVVVKGGFPGHAALVADEVENPRTGERRFLLVQGYMPAQSLHVPRNPDSDTGSPWYAAPIRWPLRTPEWSFPEGSLKRWPAHPNRR